MLKTSVRLAAVTLLVIFAFRSFADEAFLKIAEIEGESTREGHPGEIEFTTYSLGISAPVTYLSGVIQVGKANFKEITITKGVDKATPRLMEAVAKATRLPEAVLTLYRTDREGRPFKYLVITLNDTFISSVNDAGNTDLPGPDVETVTLVYQKITVDYTAENGATSNFSWDIAKQQTALNLTRDGAAQ